MGEVETGVEEYLRAGQQASWTKTPMNAGLPEEQFDRTGPATHWVAPLR